MERIKPKVTFMQRYRKEKWVTELAWATSLAAINSKHESKPFRETAFKIHSCKRAVIQERIKSLMSHESEGQQETRRKNDRNQIT